MIEISREQMVYNAGSHLVRDSLKNAKLIFIEIPNFLGGLLRVPQHDRRGLLQALQVFFFQSVRAILRGPPRPGGLPQPLPRVPRGRPRGHNRLATRRGEVLAQEQEEVRAVVSRSVLQKCNLNHSKGEVSRESVSFVGRKFSGKPFQTHILVF